MYTELRALSQCSEGRQIQRSKDCYHETRSLLLGSTDSNRSRCGRRENHNDDKSWRFVTHYMSCPLYPMLLFYVYNYYYIIYLICFLFLSTRSGSLPCPRILFQARYISPRPYAILRSAQEKGDRLRLDPR